MAATIFLTYFQVVHTAADLSLKLLGYFGSNGSSVFVLILKPESYRRCKHIDIYIF
jgi:hypothetical protein